ncbi:MAG: FKBP-type peptidyl-prolyl cis-trans isomerase [Gammaproteobacteria bacterium]|jgi:FKBP-type peptidyl-prolyl cis-trans isomerase FkpA
MNKLIFSLATAALMVTGCGEQAETEQPEETAAQAATDTPAPAVAEMSDAEKRAYALGANSAGFLVRSFPEFDQWGMSVDRDLVKQGFNDMLDDKAVLTTEEMQTILLNLQKEIQERITQIEQEQLEKSNAANKAFMEQHAAQEGVVVTDSGLQYRILEEGTGANPTPADTVRVHYRGTLVDGTEFDSSYNSGQPIDFPLGRVIQGWVEGIQLVKEGGKIELVMGPDLAYGPQATAAIPANSALVFQVELLKINPEPEPVQEETPEQPPTDG